MVKDKDLELLYNNLAIFIKVNGYKVKKMGLENGSINQLNYHIKDNGKMEKEMVMAISKLKIKAYTKENSYKIIRMVMELSYFSMATLIKDNIQKVDFKEKVFMFGRQEIVIKASSKKVVSMAKGYGNHSLGKNMMAFIS